MANSAIGKIIRTTEHLDRLAKVPRPGAALSSITALSSFFPLGKALSEVDANLNKLRVATSSPLGANVEQSIAQLRKTFAFKSPVEDVLSRATRLTEACFLSNLKENLPK